MHADLCVIKYTSCKVICFGNRITFSRGLVARFVDDIPKHWDSKISMVRFRREKKYTPTKYDVFATPRSTSTNKKASLANPRGAVLAQGSILLATKLLVRYLGF